MRLCSLQVKAEIGFFLLFGKKRKKTFSTGNSKLLKFVKSPTYIFELLNSTLKCDISSSSCFPSYLFPLKKFYF
jgi:hypothetical protein